MTSLSISFFVLISIPVAIAIATAVAGKLRSGKPLPSARVFARESLTSVGITVAVTIGICLVLGWTGFTESQFYRPSTRDFEEHVRLDLAPQDVLFESNDGTNLHGWFIPAEEQPIGTVIHLHGSDRNISYTVKNSHWLAQYGFNVFVFDYRGYGRSEGQPSRRGVVEDAVAAIEHVRSRSEVDPDRVFLWGQSMGGQLAIVAADRVGRVAIRAVVAEATYASYRHHVKDKLAEMGPLWLIQWGAWLVTRDTYAAQDVVGRIAPTPILVIHGTADRGVKPYHSEWLYSAAGEPKDIWRVEGFGHLDVFKDPVYRERLVQFLTRHVRADASGGE